MADPLAEGAVQETVAAVSPAVAETPVGASGVADGVTGLEARDAEPESLALVATTVKVYAVPLVRPVTVQESVGSVLVQVFPPVDEVTV